MSTLLLVDENPDVLRALTHQLTDLGHDVLATARPEEAIELVESGATPDLAVLEISLPDMTGFELAQILHECPNAKRLPVIFAGISIVASAKFTDESGTAWYFNKAELEAELPAAIEELLPVSASRH